MGGWTAEQRIAYHARRRERNRELIDQLKGTTCCRCEIEYPPYVLQFHHRDPNEKLFVVAASTARSEAVIRAEIAKCDVLCANCHYIVEHEGRY